MFFVAYLIHNILEDIFCLMPLFFEEFLSKNTASMVFDKFIFKKITIVFLHITVRLNLHRYAPTQIMLLQLCNAYKMSFKIICHLENAELSYLLHIIQYLQIYNCLRGKTNFHRMLIKNISTGRTETKEKCQLWLILVKAVTTNCDEG